MTKPEKIIVAAVIMWVAMMIGSGFIIKYILDRNAIEDLYVLCPPGKHCECIDNSCTLMEIVK